MSNFKTLLLLEDQFGGNFKSGITGDSLYYSLEWQELQKVASRIANRKSWSQPKDVREADYALDLIGIPHQAVEADQDQTGAWIICWR